MKEKLNREEAVQPNQKQVRKLNALNRAFAECFGSKAGKAVLDYLEDTYHIHETTYRGDFQATSYSEGQRTVVLDIKDRMTRKPEGEDNG